MPTQNPTAKTPAETGLQVMKPKLLPIKASVNWLNPDENGSVRASASLTIGAFAVHGIKVISGSKGDFVSMPSYKSGDGYKDIFHAVTADAREQMNEAVMAAYEQKLSDQNQGEELSDDDQTEAPADEPDQSEKGPVMNM